MSKPESLVILVSSGNAAAVEEEWMLAFDAPEATVEQLIEFKQVLLELRSLNKLEVAQSLAWTAIESVADRLEPKDILRIAGPFLEAVGSGDELRKKTAELYREAWSDREGLDALIKEAGLEVGRPVRRALRTLEVCVPLGVGDYLVGRHEPLAARVESIDIDDWEIEVTEGKSKKTYGAVNLGDEYELAEATDFRVRQWFDREGLLKELDKTPAPIVIDICRHHGGKLDNDALAVLLVPALIDSAQWKKWWTKARTALKKRPDVTIEGRTPYVIIVHDEKVSYSQRLIEEFARQREVMAQLSTIESYLQLCKTHERDVSTEALANCCETMQSHINGVVSVDGAIRCLAMMFVASEAGQTQPAPPALLDWLKSADHTKALLGRLDHEHLIQIALEQVKAAEPENWKNLFIAALPSVSQRACEACANMLTEAGCTPKDMSPAVQAMLASPIDSFSALLWLWDGSPTASTLYQGSLEAVLTRVIRGLDEARRDGSANRETLRDMATRCRSVLPARRFERFQACLASIEQGMASALKTQISRSDAIGPALREDMLSLLNEKFVLTEEKPKIQPWEREEVIYVSAEGLRKKQAEAEHHVNVKIRDNAKAIGEAAAKGDLSENSEYKFALEERDLLQARLAQMNDELGKAQALEPEQIPTDHVGVGTHVVFRRTSDGEPYDMTFLGPWDADPDTNVLNYLAPLSQKMMGKRVGDTIEFDHTGANGTYEVVSLHNGLEKVQAL